MNFHDNSKNKNRKFYFSLVSADCATFMKVKSKLKDGVCISLVGTEPKKCAMFGHGFLSSCVFFCANLSFRDMVDFVLYSELETCKKSGRDFCEPDSDANQ